MANFFVYGTLRPGEQRWHAIQPYVKTQTSAVLHGADLFTTGPWPFIVLDDESETGVHGELLVIDDSILSQALSVLDGIEGYYPDFPEGSLFLRKELEIDVPDRAENLVNAWVYIGGADLCTAARGHRYDQIDSGNWKDR